MRGVYEIIITDFNAIHNYMTNNILEKINMNLSLGAVFIIVFGYVKLKIYYLLYDINISAYLNTSDIINLVLGDIIFLGFILFFPIISFLKKTNNNVHGFKVEHLYSNVSKFTINTKKLMAEIQNFSKKNYLLDLTKLEKEQKTYCLRTSALLGIIIIMFLFGYQIINNKTDFFTIVIFQAQSFILSVYLGVLIPTKYLISRSFNITVITLSSIFYLFISVFCDYYTIKNDESIIVIKFENSEIRTTPELKKIGSTDKYLILWNEKEKKPNYISNDKIVSIE